MLGMLGSLALAIIAAAVAVFLFINIVVLFTYVEEIIDKRRLAHLPGPKLPALLGCVKEINQIGILNVVKKYYEQYGPIYKIRIGRIQHCIISDPEAIRTILGKALDRGDLTSGASQMLTGVLAEVDENSLLRLKGDTWLAVRRAWAPAFSVASLKRYMPLIDECCKPLVRTLQRACDTGAEVDLYKLATQLQLSVVGQVAYGMDFQCFDDDDDDSGADAADRPVGKTLVAAAREMFATMRFGADNPVMIMMGGVSARFHALLLLIAHVLHDEATVRHLKARKLYYDSTVKVMNDWKQRRAAKGAAGSDGGAPPDSASGGNAGSGDGVGGILGLKGIAPGSWLDLLLEARAKGTGEKLTDMQVAGSAQAFLTGGVQPSTATLAYTLYCLALNPHAEAKVLQEVDALGLDTPMNLENAEQLTYLEACVHEALRLFPPAYSTKRALERPMEVLGYHLPQGTSVWMHFHIFQRDPAFWPRPDEFLPERWLPGAQEAGLAPSNPHAFSPFGGGPRICIGQKFFMLEAKVALVRTFQRFRLQLSPGQVPLQLGVGLTMTPRDGIMVRVRPRSAVDDCDITVEVGTQGAKGAKPSDGPVLMTFDAK